jgi:hypothetical protein
MMQEEARHTHSLRKAYLKTEAGLRIPKLDTELSSALLFDSVARTPSAFGSTTCKLAMDVSTGVRTMSVSATKQTLHVWNLVKRYLANVSLVSSALSIRL